MNKAAVNALYFVGGAAFGSAVTYFAIRKSLSEESNDKVNEIRKFYNEKMKKINKIQKDICDEANSKNEKLVEALSASSSEESTDYTTLYKPKTGEVSYSDISKEIKNDDVVQVIDINEFGIEPDYDAETIEYYKEYELDENNKPVDMLYDRLTGSFIDPDERLGPRIRELLRTTKEDCIYIQDTSIMLYTEIEIHDKWER